VAQSPVFAPIAREDVMNIQRYLIGFRNADIGFPEKVLRTLA
jgi:hypothetical protein